jgi:hypothetical protein
VYAGAATAMDQAQQARAAARPPAGCSDPGRWVDAYLIAEAHRAERGVCACGRPLPCIAAERAASIMAETMRAADEAAAAADAQRAFSEAITQELPIIRVEPAVPPPAPVGARFARRRGNDEPWESAEASTGSGAWPVVSPSGEYPPPPAEAEAPVGARFYRERRGSRHRA